MVFAITYQIDTSKRDYSHLYKKIESLGAWMHYLASTWFVSPPNPKTAREIYDEIIPFIDGAEDYLIVVQITDHYSGWLPKKGWAWMKERTF